MFRNTIRQILLLVIFVCTGLIYPHTTHSQSLNRLGIKAGYVSAQTIYDSNIPYLAIGRSDCPSPFDASIGILDYNPSFLVGLIGEINTSKYLNIQTGFSYFKTTKKSEQCSRQQFTNQWMNLDIALKVSPGKAKLNPYFVAGPRFRGLIGESYGIINYEEIRPQNIFERTSLDLLLGIGLDFNENFSLEIQYISGLTSIYRYIEWPNQDIYFSNRDRFFMFNLTYYFIRSKRVQGNNKLGI